MIIQCKINFCGKNYPIGIYAVAILKLCRQQLQLCNNKICGNTRAVLSFAQHTQLHVYSVVLHKVFDDAIKSYDASILHQLLQLDKILFMCAHYVNHKVKIMIVQHITKCYIIPYNFSQFINRVTQLQLHIYAWGFVCS